MRSHALSDAFRAEDAAKAKAQEPPRQRPPREKPTELSIAEMAGAKRMSEVNTREDASQTLEGYLEELSPATQDVLEARSLLQRALSEKFQAVRKAVEGGADPAETDAEADRIIREEAFPLIRRQLAEKKAKRLAA